MKPTPLVYVSKQIALFLHGFCVWQILTVISHKEPVKPLGHWHLTCAGAGSVQIPPLKQGWDKHSGMSCSQYKPA